MPPSTSVSSTVGQARHPQVNVMSSGQCDLPQGHCGHCHHLHARGGHSDSTGGDNVPLQPTPMPPLHPWEPQADPLLPSLLFPNPKIPKSQNSPFWKAPRKIIESNMTQHGSRKDLEVEKQLLPKGSAKSMGREVDLGTLKMRQSDSRSLSTP